MEAVARAPNFVQDQSRLIDPEQHAHMKAASATADQAVIAIHCNPPAHHTTSPASHLRLFIFASTVTAHSLAVWSLNVISES